jgi:hypothetical protein
VHIDLLGLRGACGSLTTLVEIEHPGNPSEIKDERKRDSDAARRNGTGLLKALVKIRGRGHC